MVSWGSTYGPAHLAVERSRLAGLEVSHIHLRLLWPLPVNLESLLSGFDEILVPEMNMGQLSRFLRSELIRPVKQFCKVTGQPMRITEIMSAICEVLED